MMEEAAMTPTFTQTGELDQAYTALAEATARVGEAKTPLFLATLALALLSRQDDVDEALALIAQAERLTAT
jgi:hypothetical protein